MKQIKGLELISGVELPFGICLNGAIKINSEEMSVKVEEAITRLKNLNKSIRDSKDFWNGQINHLPN